MQSFVSKSHKIDKWKGGFSLSHGLMMCLGFINKQRIYFVETDYLNFRRFFMAMSMYLFVLSCLLKAMSDIIRKS